MSTLFNRDIAQSDERCSACTADIPVVLEFHAPMTHEQQQWLRTTRVRMRSVAFHIDDAASAALLHDNTTLVRFPPVQMLPSWKSNPCAREHLGIVHHRSQTMLARYKWADHFEFPLSLTEKGMVLAMAQLEGNVSASPLLLVLNGQCIQYAHVAEQR